MRRLGGVLALAGLLLAALGVAAPEDAGRPDGPDASNSRGGSAMLLEVEGPIGPATTDYLQRALEQAAETGKRLVIIRLDTPGGLVAATREIVQAIRSSPVPVAVWVAPQGARAASAGTYILYASHVAAMAPATNVGAATPISIGGGAPGGDRPSDSDDSGQDGGQERQGQRKGQSEDPGQKQPSGNEGGDQPGGQPAQHELPPAKHKAINDAAAWIRSLAQATGRNADWAERAVREAASLTAREAVERNVADFIAANVGAVLAKAHGRSVEVAGRTVTLHTRGLAVERYEPDWRTELLAVITNPTIAYLLLMVGIYGLLLEGVSPGSLVPGTIGGISLLLGLYALQLLPVNYAGLLLMVLGLALMIAEAFAPSFGILGIGGVIAMVIGSVVLMDTDMPWFSIDLGVIVVMALFSTAIMAALIWMAARAWRLPVTSGGEEVFAVSGEVIDPVDANNGFVWLLGERWLARSEQPIAVGRKVRVLARNGLVLTVEADPTLEE